MFTQVRSRIDPYKLYTSIDVVNSFVTATAYTTAVVYRVRSGHLNPLQLVLLGTAVEISYLAMQLPSGVLADLVSRRLCVIAGRDGRPRPVQPGIAASLRYRARVLPRATGRA